MLLTQELDTTQDTPQPALRLNPLIKDFVSGAVAGAVALTLTQPLDTVRIRLQQAGLTHTSAAASASATAPVRSKVPSAWSILRDLVRHEGVRAPWKGMSVPLLMASVQSAILFQVYGATLRLVNPEEAHRASHHDSHPSNTPSTDSATNSQSTSAAASVTAQAAAQSSARIPTPGEGFIAGCAAGFGQVWVWSPVEMVKLRMQLQSVPRGSPGYVGPMALARRIWATEGIRGLYRGVTPTILRDFPSFGVYFGLYHVIVEALEGHKHPDDASPLTHIIAGGVGGAVSWLPVYHFDVIKTRMQASSYKEAPNKTFLDYGKQIVREQGARALYRGLPTTLVRAFVMDSAAFLTYRLSLKAMADL